jgi:Fe-Mn family superoxide dismutase
MAFEVPPLPYGYDALAPTIDEETMQLHHDKHHQAYVDNANKALDGTEWADRPVEEVLRNLESLPGDKQGPVRNNAGGHANHSLFWRTMGANAGGAPSGDVGSAIDDAFGSFDQFKETFNANGVGRFGSGWTWLVWNGSALELYSTANQVSPYLQGHVPVLGNDVWEHAYYLTYRNRRPEYLGAWWNVVDWDAVGKELQAARG